MEELPISIEEYMKKKEEQLSLGGLRQPSNHEIHAIAYLTFLENPYLTPDAKITYLHLKARGGENGVIWFKQKELYPSLGYKRLYYMNILQELEDKLYIRRFPRNDKETGSKKSDAIFVAPLDPYTGLPLVKGSEDDLRAHVKRIVESYILEKVKKTNPNATISGFVFSDKSKKKAKKETVKTDSAENNNDNDTNQAEQEEPGAKDISEINYDEFNNKFHELIKNTYSENTYSTWFSEVKITDIQGSKIILHVPNSIAKQIIETHYIDSVLTNLKVLLEGYSIDRENLDFECKYDL